MTPTKLNDDKKLKLLAKQVLDLTQTQIDSGDFTADIIMLESMILSIRLKKEVVKDLWGLVQQREAKQVVSGTEGV